MSNPDNGVPNEQPKVTEAVNPAAVQAIRAVLKELEQGNADAAIRLFIKDQTLSLFLKDADLVEWLIKTIGKQDTKKLINAFAHAPCLNCKKGLQKCESCEGVGHFKHEAVCDSCFGLGSEICNFCAGTGWATIDFVPPGLRFVVFTDRLKIAATRAMSLLEQQFSVPQEKDAPGKLAEYGKLLVDLNRQISILEGIVSVPMQIVQSAHVPMPQISEIIRTSAGVALKSQKKLTEIVRAMATASQIDAENYDKDSIAHQLSVKRAKFYSLCIASSPPLADTFLEHPLLNKITTKLDSHKFAHQQEKNGPDG